MTIGGTIYEIIKRYVKNLFKTSPPPCPPRRCEKIPSGLFPVIPAEAGIQYFQAFKNSLDPGFHRGDD